MAGSLHFSQFLRFCQRCFFLAQEADYAHSFGAMMLDYTGGMLQV